MRKRVAYSQNFLKNKSLVSGLIEKSSITKQDIVFEIGAGQGIITQELLNRSGKVVAFEIDKNLFNKLKERFDNEKSLELILGNFLAFPLPKKPYKVFSNIPFNITSAVIKKLTQASNPPEDAYLVVQRETAKKYAGKPYDSNNSQIAILLKPWFELVVVHNFKGSGFSPRPSVNTVLLKISKKGKPSISDERKSEYQDFVVYTFSQFKPNVVEGLSRVFGKKTITNLSEELNFSPRSKPSELEIKHWLGLFDYFSKRLTEKQKSKVKGSFARLVKQQGKLSKIHRTRLDKNWKKFGKR